MYRLLALRYILFIITMFMFSISQTACGLGWFPERESQELLVLVDSVCVVPSRRIF